MRGRSEKSSRAPERSGRGEGQGGGGFRKGDRVYLEGEIQYRSYEDREGVTRYVTEIRARELVMLGGRNGDTPAGKEPTREPAAVGSTAPPDDFDVPDSPEDDLPF